MNSTSYIRERLKSFIVEDSQPQELRMMIFVGTNVQAGASFPFNKVSIVSIAFFAISETET